MGNIGVIGAGRWGKNLIHEFNRVSNIKTVCTRGKEENKNWINENYPSVQHTTNYFDILNDSTIDIVVVATPVDTHYDLAKKALNAQKHVFVEKPTATRVVDFEELNKIAKEKNKVLFTGYVYLYHDVFNFIKEKARNEEVKSLTFEWMKMGSFKEDIIWNLLSHEIALCIDLLGKPKGITLTKKERIQTKVDKISVVLGYGKTLIAKIHINRFSKKKVKKMKVEIGSTSYTWIDDALYEVQDGRERIFIMKEKNRPLNNEILTFLQLVKKGKYYYDSTADETIRVAGKLIGQEEGI